MSVTKLVVIAQGFSKATVNPDRCYKRIIDEIGYDMRAEYFSNSTDDAAHQGYQGNNYSNA